MVQYEYDVNIEQFKRVDGRGVPLPFNITEARRIESMMDLGMKSPTILKKIDFVNDVSMTNLRTFMNNLSKGNILGLENDYPIPDIQFKEVDYDLQIVELDRRVSKIEHRLDRLFESNNKGVLGRIKEWIN